MYNIYIYVFENSGYVTSKEHHPMEEGSTKRDLIAFSNSTLHPVI